jgi:hypothetical protein
MDWKSGCFGGGKSKINKNKSMTNQAQIQKNLMKELGIDDLSQDKQEQLIIKMTEVILKRMFLETIERLSEDDQEAYEQMISMQASPDDVENFLRSKIENYDQILEKVVLDFKEEMKKTLT